MKIKINKKNIPKLYIYIQIIYVCVVQLLIEVGLPDRITLICDLINIVLLIYLIKYYGKLIKYKKYFLGFIVSYLSFFLFGTFSALVSGMHLLLWMWSIRNFGRFVVFFVSCCVFLNVEDTKRIKKFIWILGHVNFGIALFQFLVLGKSGDYIGGLFGTSGGVANTWLNVFLLAVIIIQFSEWLAQKRKTVSLLTSLIEGIIIAIISELKFYYIEIAIFIIIGFFVSKKTKKIIEKLVLILCFSIIAVSVSVPILYNLFPHFENFFSIDVIIRTATNSYTGNNDLGRATAIYDIANRVFKKDVWNIIFGIGLGNGEYSGDQKILQSAFYIKNKYTNYYWFTDAVIMIQNGLVGVVLYITTFIEIIRKAIVKFKDQILYIEWKIIGLLAGIMGLLLFVYNISLNTEAAYIYYLILSFCCIGEKSLNKEKI